MQWKSENINFSKVLVANKNPQIPYLSDHSSLRTNKYGLYGSFFFFHFFLLSMLSRTFRLFHCFLHSSPFFFFFPCLALKASSFCQGCLKVALSCRLFYFGARLQTGTPPCKYSRPEMVFQRLRGTVYERQDMHWY